MPPAPPRLPAGPFKAFADSTWIEVIHMGGLGDEHIGAWFFHASGSGIWVNVGKTVHFTDHGDAFTFFKTPANNEKMTAAAKAQGYDSIQFLAHSDCEYNTCRRKPGVKVPNMEIVITALDGVYPCADKKGTSPKIKMGWHSTTCACSNAMNMVNCALSPKPPPIKPHTGKGC